MARTRSLVRTGLGGGYVVLAVARCLRLWEVNRLDPKAPQGPLEAETAAYLLLAVGIVLFVGALDFRGVAAVAGRAFRVLAVAACLLATGDLAVAADEAGHSVPRLLVLVTVLGSVGEAAVAYGWWAWSRAGRLAAQQRAAKASQESWPAPRRFTQAALASAYALYALADVVTVATHESASPTRTIGVLVHAVGYGTSAVGHWQLVAVLAWIAVAQTARPGLALLAFGGCVLAVVPYLAGTVPSAALNIQAVASVALGLGWLVWAAAGRSRNDA